MELSYGYCQCGCGGRPKLQNRNNARLGIKKGDPNKYCPGHNPPQHREEHSQWKGGFRKTAAGYMTVLMPEHPRANSAGYVFEHVLIAEKALGKSLPAKAVIHHTDNDKGRTDKFGLVICQDASLHQLIHRKMIALSECGHADWRKCSHCNNYDDIANMKRANKNYLHARCSQLYQHEYHLRRGKSMRANRGTA